MTLKYSTLTALLTLSGAAIASAATYDELTGFGSDSFTALQSFGSDTQNLLGYTIVGSDLGSTLIGTFSSYALTGTPTIYFTGTLSGANPGSAFQIQLYDADFDAILYNANWTSFTSGVETTLALTYVSTDLSGGGSFDGNVSAFGLLTNGGGANLNFTLNSLQVLSAIPEPSTAAALGGLAILGFAAARRQRRSA